MKIKIYFILFFLIAGRTFSQWELTHPGFPGGDITDWTFLDESNGFAVNYSGSIMYTTDGGVAWTVIKNYPRDSFSQIAFLDDLFGFAYSPVSYSGDNTSLIYTEDGGVSWTKSDVPIGDCTFLLPVSRTELIKVTEYLGTIEKLDNFYGGWRIAYKLPDTLFGDLMGPIGKIIGIEKYKGSLFAAANSSNALQTGMLSDSLSFILESRDEGNTWNKIWQGLRENITCFKIADSSNWWIGTDKTNIYFSNDFGNNWIKKYSYPDSNYEGFISSLDISGPSVIAVTDRGMVVNSIDNGENWQSNESFMGGFDHKIKFNSNSIAFLTGNGFYKTTDSGINWFRIDNENKTTIRDMNFVSTKNGFACGGSFAYSTTDGGYSWKYLYDGLEESVVGIHAFNSDEIFLATRNKIMKSENGGETWETKFENMDFRLIRKLNFYNKNIGIVPEVWSNKNDSVYTLVTTDGGENWDARPISNPKAEFVTSFEKIVITDPDHFWFVNQQGLWLSRDTAKTWELNDNIQPRLWGFDFADSLTGWVQFHHDTLGYTSDGGINWVKTELPYSAQFEDLKYVGKSYFNRPIIYMTGIDGILMKTSFPSENYFYTIPTYTKSYFTKIATYIDGNYSHNWVAGQNFYVLHREDYVLTDVNDESGNTKPDKFSLSQNYPNPFNPSTAIRYSIPRQVGQAAVDALSSVEGLQQVSLKVFDVLGNEITTLVNDYQRAGNYEVTFNGAGLASGIYICRLSVGAFSQIRKMVLLR